MTLAFAKPSQYASDEATSDTRIDTTTIRPTVCTRAYNAKADWDLGPQGRGAGLAACWEAPRSPVVPTKRDPFSDDRVYEFEQCITFG